ncbi:MAG TPA: PaaX family transcriptional regulator C-terminal domain-containing protein [Solirubrobacteraceae bacterium]|nr:PaaX family transcriptional regulator C-terminal domain-containing protein [Solirubrobacteraceae bacterium]
MAVRTSGADRGWDEAREDGRGLPRSQVGTTPQHLLMTLFGDYWSGHHEHLPSAALVDLLAEFDVTQASARAALNRLTRRELLQSTKLGRQTYYGLAPHALELLQETARRIVAFGTQEVRSWDGSWTLVAFSVPEAQRRVRYAVRTRLRWLGFAALFDGLWCSPWDERDAALAALSELGIASATVMRAGIDPRSTLQALDAWDLEEVREKYLEFEAEFTPILDQARKGRLTASRALVERTKVMDSWRSFLGDEPDLPAELLPGDWPRARMRELFIDVYDSLAPVAKGRCQQVIAQHAPELAELVTTHDAMDARS